jgi:hypothetical protein
MIWAQLRATDRKGFQECRAKHLVRPVILPLLVPLFLIALNFLVADFEIAVEIQGQRLTWRTFSLQV